ncbi:alpha/beta fold hydrolase [Phormidium sp. LEGE 05292]|uniref:alpha/beta hydrolase n=1 Tax=[Phormidium] sp. LEGE 05292 TaxID=767427 RepID=UPI0018818A34|nr:alpha/beta fold hydrolase [Phormidium sp. LEGE 05292]MBE9228129.1 alpha/beta fold hydrolase [Phormidium sp. LEGE 05292]
MKYKLFPKRYTGLILSLLLLAVGILICFLSYPSEIQTRSIKIDVAPNRHLIGTLYTPKTAKPPYPVMVLTHGINSTKEIMSPLAIELAREGIAALTFDFGGFGESYFRPYSEGGNDTDGKAVMAFIQANPKLFDITRIGIGGHSMGGATALGLANDDNRYKTTVVLGMSGLATPIYPANLLMGIGLYEQLHPPSLMREMLQSATGKNISEFQQSGDFQSGKARLLVISPTADHLIEPYDSSLIKQSVSWVKQAFGIPGKTKPLIATWYMLGMFVTCFSGLGTGGYLVRFVAYQKKLKRWIPGFIIAIALTFLALGNTGIIDSLWASNLILFSLGLLLVCNYVLRFPQKWTTTLRVTGLYIALFLGTYGAIALISTVPELLSHPQYITSIPQFLLQWPIALFYSRYRELRAVTFPIYSYGLQPSYLLLIPLIPELIIPGIILTGAEKTISWIVCWVRQPLHFHKFFLVNTRSLIILLGLLPVLTAVIYHQIHSKILSSDTAIVAIQTVGQGAILPGCIIILLLRQKWFQNLESRYQ